MNQPVTPTGEVHPAADVFPMIEGQDFDALVESIAEQGLQEPIWLTPDGVLLDGRNRLAACKQAGVAPTFRVYDGDDLVDFIIRMNIHRRDLDVGPRAFAGLEILPIYESEAAKSVGGRPASEKPRAPGHEVSEWNRRSVSQAAKLVRSSGRSVARAAFIAKEAPELVDDVKRGRTTLKAAERVIRDREAEQRRTTEAAQQAKQKKAGTRTEIYQGDFREELAHLTNIDAIITDPPYPQEYLPLLDDLGAWANKVLAPDGILVILFGQTYLPEVMQRLAGGRPYRWTGCYFTPGPSYFSMGRKVHTNWKPLLVYGGRKHTFRDIFEAEGGDAGAKDKHHWGQDYGAFHQIVERLTKPSQTVVDPFMGSGTTLAAAQALGRHAIGCDLDADFVATARKRLGL